MQINELMVGDLVYIHEPECKGHRIDSIDELDGQVGADGEVYDECDIRPIPLTEEILKNNGWRKRPQRYFDEWYGCLQINEQNGRFFYASIPLNSVHELQHLLRMAGEQKAIEL